MREDEVFSGISSPSRFKLAGALTRARSLESQATDRHRHAQGPAVPLTGAVYLRTSVVCSLHYRKRARHNHLPANPRTRCDGPFLYISLAHKCSEEQRICRSKGYVGRVEVVRGEAVL